ncbi:peptidase M20 family protein [Heterostelium album PN500]|uniref:Peptidase M20 family protein n=1 Tax=Heterostelium pallidum (strain ATCC 26659 / Pp 5 / PN500) TaxID=670386 RepID=D3B3V0_HETP5|nr:peptidase M20 family protein [Heterostelium album PN500]EFA83998.1 peptidase M20 family protein [Heterostelium album PN500]|eukprot:XP_020436115.1 peptidase M20 family protein [Heterostelium album PN500]
MKMTGSSRKKVRTGGGLVKTVIFRVLLLVLSIIVYNTVMFTSKQPNVELLEKDHIDSYSALSARQLAARLSDAIKFKTVSYNNPNDIEYDEFIKLHRYLEQTFPKTFKYLEVEVVNKYSLLLKWQGSDRDLKPVMLAGHMDVVPITNHEHWTHPPFEGVLDDQYIWGRGSMDDKLVVMGVLEAVEDMITQGFRPQRTLYLAFGHDEELGGANGAKHIAQLLMSRNVQFEYILDEGLLIITPPVLPGVDKPIATVGNAEKGFLTVELTVTTVGGHSSMPPKNTAIGILSSAIAKLEANPMKSNFKEVANLLDFVGREASLLYRIIFSNLWLFRPIISMSMSNKPSLDSLQSGTKPNVLPYTANATLNFRISPSNNIQDVLDHIRNTIQDDRIQIVEIESTEPAPVSPTDSGSFRLLQSTILQEFPNIIVAPAVMVANTDTRWYWDLSPNIYRFCPQILSNSDLTRFHGIDERLSIDNYRQVVDFYYHLIRNGDVNNTEFSVIKKHIQY